MSSTHPNKSNDVRYIQKYFDNFAELFHTFKERLDPWKVSQAPVRPLSFLNPGDFCMDILKRRKSSTVNKEYHCRGPKAKFT